MDRVIEWLSANVPPRSDTTIIHGDFRCDNMIFHPTRPHIIAVLDWELSTLGDPLADFAYHAMMYHMPPRIVAGLADADVTALNIPSEQTYVDNYCRRVGRASIPGYSFYLAFNFFRLAAIFHGIKGRVLRGTAVSNNARERAQSFPVLAKLAWMHAEGA
jgi:aminoglycoside phosphotransferase (APT) family kinase protein